MNDFRKIAGIEAYSPTDNVSELTARVNDDGWETSYVNWLKGSRLNRRDMLLVFSVGGGNREHQVSMNLVRCLELAREVGGRHLRRGGPGRRLHRPGGQRLRHRPHGQCRCGYPPRGVLPGGGLALAGISSRPPGRGHEVGVGGLSMRRAVFLDRDGVLNRVFLHEDGKTHPPASPHELEVLPGVREACEELHRAGFLLIVVTNQPDVARGTQPRAVVEAINRELRRQIPLDDIRVCFHDGADNCPCRKPKPGMLLEAASIWGIDLQKSFMVGDRWTDIESGRRAGCRTVLVNAAGPELRRRPPDFQAASLPEAVTWIARQAAIITTAEAQEKQ